MYGSVFYSEWLGTPGVFVINLSDVIIIDDKLVKSPGKNLIDSLVLVDTISKGVGKRLTDAVILVDSLSILKILLISLTDSIVIVDSISKGVRKSLLDTIVIDDKLVKGIGKIFSDSVTIVDSIQTVVVASSAEGSIIGTGVGSKTLSANYLQVGTIIWINVRGILTTQAAPVSLRIRGKLGSTVVLDTTAIIPKGSLTNRYFEVTGFITCRSIGVSGSVFSQGSFKYDIKGLTNLTRYISIPSTNFGSNPVQSERGAADVGIVGAFFSGTAENDLFTTFVVPDDFQSLDSIKIEWTTGGSSTNNAIWRVGLQVITGGLNVASFPMSTADTTVTPGGTVDVFNVTTLNLPAVSLAPGDIVRVMIQRRALDAGDTNTDLMLFNGLKLQYAAVLLENTTDEWDMKNTGVNTVDTTSPQVIDVTAEWGVGVSGSSISGTNALIEALKV